MRPGRLHVPADDLREPARERPRRLEEVLHRAGLHDQRAVQQRERRLGRDQRHHRRDAAHPSVLRHLHQEGDRRRHDHQRGADLSERGQPREGRRAGGQGARGGRHGERPHPGPGLHVRPRLRRPRRPHLGDHVDGPGRDRRLSRSLAWAGAPDTRPAAPRRPRP
ncbi:hypothetical protein SGPA1_11414 [Streptomyces misionensis JCM 4497]